MTTRCKKYLYFLAILVVLIIGFIAYHFSPLGKQQIPNQSTEFASIQTLSDKQPKDNSLSNTLLASLFTLLGIGIAFFNKIYENRDSLIFSKKFEHYQKYLATLTNLISKGSADQNDLINVQEQCANITILMNTNSRQSLNELTRQTAKILWHLHESQAKKRSSFKQNNSTDVNYVKHLHTIARAMQADIHDSRYKRSKNRDDKPLIDMFSKDVFDALPAWGGALFGEDTRRFACLIARAAHRNLLFSNPHCKIYHIRDTRKKLEGFYWQPLNIRTENDRTWNKQTARELCAYFGGYVLQDFSWFVPHQLNRTTRRTRIRRMRSKLSNFAEIATKQLEVYEAIDTLLISDQKKSSWIVQLWDYDTVFLQQKKKNIFKINKSKDEDLNHLFIDVTYCPVGKEYHLSMGYRIEETNLESFENYAAKLEKRGNFAYHRETRRGHFKNGIRSIISVCSEVRKYMNELDSIV